MKENRLKNSLNAKRSIRWYHDQNNWVLTEAEAEHQRAETERQRAETERQRAEEAEAKLESLLQKLRESGLDPDTFLNS